MPLPDLLIETGCKSLKDYFPVMSEKLDEDQFRIYLFCSRNQIEIYNVNQLKYPTALLLLQRLFEHLHDDGENCEGCLQWIADFNGQMASAPSLAQLHASAHSSIFDQYDKTKKVSPTTLLTDRDIKNFFEDPSVSFDHIIAFAPIPLKLYNDVAVLQEWVENNKNNYTLFIPITHDEHWFYLLHQNNQWHIHDSQPMKEGRLSERQLSIIANCESLLQKMSNEPLFIKYKDPLEEINEEDLLSKIKEEESTLDSNSNHPINDTFGELNFNSEQNIASTINTKTIFHTTGEQQNDYDCGTRVINAYCRLADSGYIEKSHQKILLELLKKQNANHAVFPENLEVFFEYDPSIQLSIESVQSVEPAQKINFALSEIEKHQPMSNEVAELEDEGTILEEKYNTENNEEMFIQTVYQRALPRNFNKFKNNESPPKKISVNEKPNEEPCLVYRLNESLVQQQKNIAFRNNFNELLTQLTNISSILDQKLKSNSNYKNIVNDVKNLQDTLKTRKVELFEKSLKAEDSFKSINELFASVQIEAEKHRGWHKAPFLLRGVLGVLAVITIVPALVVLFAQSKKQHSSSFSQTFFATPKTNTAQQLDEIKNQLQNMETVEEDVSSLLRIQQYQLDV